MAYQSLYRRYRSRRFVEVLGQDQVITALRNAVRDERVGHAYLFSGPRGTGKTSSARILAKALNCTNLQDGEPCCECDACISIEAGTSYDLQELDAASNNGVEKVRDLVERVALGSPGRTKVYILDEVHMLSAGASNALLKTLEEPPPHVVFVLATTDPHKVLPTIRSRTQHFEFHLLPADVLEAHVRFVIEDAGLDVSEAAIEQVLRQGGGSARDTLSALDQVAAAGGVTESTEFADALIDAVCANETGSALRAVADAVGAGRDPRILGESLLARLRDAFLLRMGATLPQATEAAQEQAQAWADQLTDRSCTRALEAVGSALLEMRQAPDARIPLEVALVRITRPPEGAPGDTGPLLERIERLEQALAGGAPPVSRSPAVGASSPESTPPLPSAAAPSPEAVPTPTAVPTPAVVRDSTSPGSDAVEPEGRASVDPGDGEPVPGPGIEPGPRTHGGDEPAAPAGSSRRRPGDAARARLVGSGGASARRTAPTPAGSPAPPSAPPPMPPELHRRADESTDPPPADPTAAGSAGATEPSTSVDPGSGPRARPTPDMAATAPTASPPPPGQAAPVAEPESGGELTDEAFGVGWAAVLDKLTGMTGAMYRAASFAGIDGHKVTLSVGNEVQRQRSEQVRDKVEQALSDRFGRKLELTLVVDRGGSAPAATGRRIGAAIESADESEVIDVHDLEDAPPDPRSGVDRLTEAFPGSELIQEDP